MLETLLALAITQPVVQGALDREAIRRVISARMPAIRACYERWGYGKAPREIQFVIGAGGNVERVALAPDTGRNLASCLRHALIATQFPRPKGGGTIAVRYPLMFQMAGEFASPPAEPQSTFSIDVDTGSYTLSRRLLSEGTRPAKDQVRVEEFINAFRYDYDPPIDEPFSIQIDGSRSPVDERRHLLRIGLQSLIVSEAERLPSNLVFLVDTSCSMTSSDRLELAKQGLQIALQHLDARDQVAVTTYAGHVEVVLEPMRADRKREIAAAIDRLGAAGSTAMASGLTVAYRQAARMLRPGSITRIIVCSDGDANVGATSYEAMLKQIAGYVAEGVRLSTIGFGTGNYRDETMEQLADRGNGNYFYVDDLEEAKRVFGRDLREMVEDVAQDVKVQLTFDPAAVRSFRLVGYENRALADRDFRDDRVDAGELGAGHQVTALYELELADGGSDLGSIAVRARPIRGGVAEPAAKEMTRAIERRRVDRSFESAPADYRFAVLVAASAELIRGSGESWGWDRVLAGLADFPGYEGSSELGSMLRRARSLGE